MCHFQYGKKTGRQRSEVPLKSSPSSIIKLIFQEKELKIRSTYTEGVKILTE
jgi:hypothetical protein